MLDNHQYLYLYVELLIYILYTPVLYIAIAISIYLSISMYLYDHVSIAMFQTISLYLLYRKRVTERQAGIDREREGREEGRE